MTESVSPHVRRAAAERIVDTVTAAITAATGPALIGLYLCS